MKFLFTTLIFAFALSLTMLSGCRKAPAPPAFDVPALIGLPVGELVKKLGAPTASPTASTIPNQSLWKRGEATLTATFKPVSGRVTELTLIAGPAENAVRDGAQSELLEAGKLKQSDARYSVDWIEAPERPLYFNGMRIVPAPRTYKVQVRVTGPAEMLQISYSLPGANPPSETFLTVAPWDATATMPDDAQIQLSARTAQSQSIASTPIVAEIVVDGKVVASKKASVVASCAWEL